MKTERIAIAVLLASALAAPVARADSYPDEYAKRMRYSSELAVLDDGMFGDEIGTGTGSLQIVQTYLDWPGNNALSVRVGKRFVAGSRYNSPPVWDIPYLHGEFGYPDTVNGDAVSGWTVWADMVSHGADTNILKRCSLFGPPPPMKLNRVIVQPNEYWHGNFLYLPGHGDQEMLERNVASPIPNDGRAYPVATKDGGVMRCLAALDSTSTPGEGFEAVMPDGTIYTFNHMVAYTTTEFSSPPPQVTMSSASAQTLQQTQPGNYPTAAPPDAEWTFSMPRKEVRIYPTTVSDRFGNTVTYVWNAADPSQLDKIVASDGRQVTFSYTSENGEPVTRFTAGGRTWTFRSASGVSTVQLPDGGMWSYDLGNLIMAGPSMYSGSSYCGDYSIDRGPYTGSITAPSGARVEYTMTVRAFGRSWVLENCIVNQGTAQYLSDANVYSVVSMDRKKITGPGLPAGGRIWTYAYSPLTYCWYPTSWNQTFSDTCRADSPTTRWVTVTDPAGHATRYTFGTRSVVNEGLLLREDAGWNGTTALRTTTYEYGEPDAIPYGAVSGYPLRDSGDEQIASRPHPLRKRTTTQQGRTFTWEVASDCSGMPYCFDPFVRPTKVKTSSVPTP